MSIMYFRCRWTGKPLRRIERFLQNFFRIQVFAAVYQNFGEKDAGVGENQQFERAARYRDLSEILTYICRCLHKFELFQNKEVLYRVPMKEGLKCFYIRKGIVMDAGKLDSGSGDSLEQFLQRAKTQKTPSAPMLSEKESKDYTDIIFAELEKAPEEDVMIL